MESKYEEIEKRYRESGLTLKEFCLSNNLNWNNTKTGIYCYRRSLREQSNDNKIIKVEDVNLNNEISVNILKFKINNIDCSIDYNSLNELSLLIGVLKNV